MFQYIVQGLLRGGWKYRLGFDLESEACTYAESLAGSGEKARVMNASGDIVHIAYVSIRI